MFGFPKATEAHCNALLRDLNVHVWQSSEVYELTEPDCTTKNTPCPYAILGALTVAGKVEVIQLIPSKL